MAKTTYILAIMSFLISGLAKPTDVHAAAQYDYSVPYYNTPSSGGSGKNSVPYDYSVPYYNAPASNKGRVKNSVPYDYSIPYYNAPASNKGRVKNSVPYDYSVPYYSNGANTVRGTPALNTPAHKVPDKVKDKVPGKAPDKTNDLTASDIPTELTADEVTHDRNLDIITARGNVVISYGERTLRADTVTYNRKIDMITSSGNVSLTDPGGEIIFAQYMEISRDMKEGVIKSLGVLLKDHSRIAANGARRYKDNIMELGKAVYTPCKPCRENPDAAPLWQIKAVKVVHDKNRQTIEYSDAWLEVGGIPVAYTPYLSHPDPTVKRRSGFLVPSTGGSSDFGTSLRTPYFFAIDPYRDLTLVPTLTAKEGAILSGEYRHLMTKGELQVRGSVTYDSDNELRGHMASKGRFNIDEMWRWGFDLNRASDDTYLRRYAFSADNTLPNSNNSLTTHLFTEGFNQRNYVSLNAYSFQGLEAGDSKGTTPYVLPMLDYNHISEPGRFGGQTSFGANLLALTRTSAADTRRLSLKAGWQAPYASPFGDQYKLSASLTGNIYHTNDLVRASSEKKYNGFSGRITPELRLDWRYPFVRNEGSSYQLIEPTMSAIVSPYSNNSDKIPNEDSQDLEFDTTNLFSSNRFTGIDKVEGGPRLNYGIKWGVYGKKGSSSSFTIGQSFHIKEDNNLPVDSGLETNFSDIVTKVNISPGKYIDLNHRTRFDKDSFKVKRNELDLTAGVPALTLNTNYVFFNDQRDDEFAGREEIAISLNSKFNRFWRGNMSGVRDLTGGGNMRTFGLNLTYEDECLLFASNITRTFFKDRDLTPTDSIMFKVMFKTLGAVNTGTQLQ